MQRGQDLGCDARAMPQLSRFHLQIGRSIKLLINRALSFSYSALRNPLHSWCSTSFANWASCPHYCKARGDGGSLLWRLRVGRASITRPEDPTLRLLMGSCQYSVTRMINILPNTLHNLTRPATSHSQGNAQESSLLLYDTQDDGLLWSTIKCDSKVLFKVHDNKLLCWHFFNWKCVSVDLNLFIVHLQHCKKEDTCFSYLTLLQIKVPKMKNHFELSVKSS